MVAPRIRAAFAFAAVLMAVFASLSMSAPAAAQTYPTRAVRNIVPFPPGGPLDLLARVVSEKLATSLGQPFVIENRAGAFGNLGAEAVAKAPPDGYTLLWVIDATFTVNPSLYPKLGFDPDKDFVPIALLGSGPSVLIVHPSVPAKSVQELVDLAKKSPLAYASGGNGSPGHLTAELFKTLARIDMTHVPYKGNAPAVASLSGGETQVFFSGAGGAIAAIRQGKARGLAVTSAARSRFLPELATMRELGYPEYDVTWWQAVFAPAGTPAAVVDVLYREMASAMQRADVIERLTSLGLDSVIASGAQLAERMRADRARWAAVVRSAKMRVD